MNSYLFLKQVRIPDSESSKTQFGLISDELQKQLRDILQSDDTKEDNKVFQQARWSKINNPVGKLNYIFYRIFKTFFNNKFGNLLIYNLRMIFQKWIVNITDIYRPCRLQKCLRIEFLILDHCDRVQSWLGQMSRNLPKCQLFLRNRVS